MRLAKEKGCFFFASMFQNILNTFNEGAGEVEGLLSSCLSYATDLSDDSEQLYVMFTHVLE